MGLVGTLNEFQGIPVATCAQRKIGAVGALMEATAHHEGKKKGGATRAIISRNRTLNSTKNSGYYHFQIHGTHRRKKMKTETDESGNAAMRHQCIPTILRRSVNHSADSPYAVIVYLRHSIKRSYTLAIVGLSLGSSFQQSHIKAHSSLVISGDPGRLGRLPLLTAITTQGSCFTFEKGFLPV